MADKKYMRLAVQEAAKNLKNLSGGPFGACIVKGNKILALKRNTVLKNDASAHAEINAIRAASRKIRSFDLSGCTIYSTTEPCPMCFSAIHWARIDRIVYGTSIAEAKKTGFNELSISCAKLKKLGRAKVKLTPGFLHDECVVLLRGWAKEMARVVY